MSPNTSIQQYIHAYDRMSKLVCQKHWPDNPLYHQQNKVICIKVGTCYLGAVLKVTVLHLFDLFRIQFVVQIVFLIVIVSSNNYLSF